MFEVVLLNDMALLSLSSFSSNFERDQVMVSISITKGFIVDRDYTLFLFFYILSTTTKISLVKFRFSETFLIFIDHGEKDYLF